LLKSRLFMSLLNEVRAVCKTLVENGWGRFLIRISDLDISHYSQSNFGELLSRKLDRIDRTEPGLIDFAKEGERAIEPAQPARSLLFHVLASPAVLPPEVKKFPLLEQLEIIENYIYSVARRSIADVRACSGNAPLAIAVFTSEYRPAIQTVHQKHADMCYSRTGVARIGTASALYVPKHRGYSSIGPVVTEIHVVPARYSVYIAAALKGDFQDFGPMRPRKATPPGNKRRLSAQAAQNPSIDTGGQPVAPDDDRLFWVPIQKVFSGTECIRGMDLRLKFQFEHRNEKLRRLELYLQANGLISRYSAGVLNKFPFVVSGNRLVTMSTLGTGSIQVSPKAHPLVQEARLSSGVRIGFKVPPGSAVSGGAFRVPSRPGGGRPAPEYVYVRQQIQPNGRLGNLNGDPNVVQRINRGGYDAQLYLDHTGDGWLAGQCEELALSVPRMLAAYSVLAPPDLYPAVKQQDFFDWWTQSAPPDVHQTLFPDFEGPLPTEPLSDARLTANITFRKRITPMSSEPVFDSNDDTYTAIVSGLGSGKDQQLHLDSFDDKRVSVLPDGASGLFAPGWDVSIDQHDDENMPESVLHLSAYGGSVPFLEDARLCAAQSAFWPAVAPDTSRLYEPGRYPAVTPIPNSRLGWDGLKPPAVLRKRTLNRPGIIRFYSLSHTDYVLRAKGQDFDFRSIASVTVEEYELWSLLMARVYSAIGASSTQEKIRWAVATFDQAQKNDPNLVQAQRATGVTLTSPYYFFLIRPFCSTPSKNPLFVHVSFERSVIAFATPDRVLCKDTDNIGWMARDF
jgi:hypothetical protein